MEFPIWAWILFHVIVAVILALDLGVFHRNAHEVKMKEALIWSGVWIAAALAFNLLILLAWGRELAFHFLTAYLVEKSLSADNILVFAVIFSYFAVPPAYQHRVLFWGILGAVLMRAIFIFAGVQLLRIFHWTIYAFGALLIYTGIRLARRSEEKVQPERNPVLRLARRFLPFTPTYHGQRFLVREGRFWMATPLLLTLLVVESTDVMFAVDSVPAVLAITPELFIAYTSNIFAILGLRALYFVLAGLIQRLRYLYFGLSAILIYIGVKMLLSDLVRIPPAISLGLVALALLISGLASWIAAQREKAHPLSQK
ncbi:TerC family protein [Thermoflexus sp.]|uniref:TerC family protein n=1 Tax=Thermoflexus sp. TaxID=1969742 RepID=UPI002ADE8E1B|nr:TerC family protein [Thermoflexus sp.]